jgi:hypothetical protein
MATQYKVIHATHHETFEKEVEEYLAKGWELVGGLTTSVATHADFTFEYSWAQAIVKKS